MSQTVQAAGIVARFPCTQAQERFWFLDRVQQGSAANNIAVQWELRGAFSKASVEAALQLVVDRHEILRTRFVENDGLPVQEVVDNVRFKLGAIDVRGVPEAERALRIEQIARDLAARPFDLSQPCAVRVTLVRFAPDRAMLLLTAHHAVFDGYSIRVLGREMGTALAAIEAGRTPDLPPLPLQYGDYAQWLAACKAGEDHAASGEYWRTELANMAYFEVPADRDRTPLGIRRGARFRLPLPDDFPARLDAAARAAGTSAFGLGAAVFAAALCRLTGAADVSFGSAVAGRGEVELEDLIGVFINPVVLRLNLDPDASLKAAVAAAQPKVRGALAHSAYPFDDLVQDLRLRGDDKRTPAVSVFFALQKVFLEEQRYGTVELRSVPSITPEITHDLHVQILGRASGWTVVCDYDADRFEEPTVAGLVELVRDCFEAVFAGGSMRLADLPLPARKAVSPAETQRSPRLAVVARPPAAAAAEDTKRRLADIWSGVLGLPPEACDGDFFELGGGSLLALRMMVRVQEAFGVRPDIADFLRAPTLAGFARDIDALVDRAETGPAAPDWSLIDLRPGEAQRPLIVSVNQPFLYHALAQRLDPGVGVVNLHLGGPGALDGGGARLTELASEAATLVRRAAAGRPVALLGQCVDGTVAVMVAQAMARTGDAPALVGMIDTWRPGTPGPTGLRRMMRKTGKRLRRWSQYLGQRRRGDIGWIEFLGKNGAARRLLIRLGRIEAPTEVERREWAVNDLIQAALADVTLPAYGGETILFRTASQRPEARERLFGWSGHLPADTPVFDLPGWHEDALLKHGIGRIVEVLGCRIARLDDRPASARHLLAGE